MQKIGQLMLDVAGTEFTYGRSRSIWQPRSRGGVILFGRNVATPEQVRALTDSIRAVKPNILVAVDQEGGRVTCYAKGFPHYRRWVNWVSYLMRSRLLH